MSRPAGPGAAFARHWVGPPPGRLGLAVSGGGDSMAMLEIAAGWARARDVALQVATVDHGLRPEAAAEAAMVGRRAAALGLPHAVLRWAGPTGGNLQAEARAARFRLLAEWAAGAGIADVALAHTHDDQAETVLMRLAREAGVDGLAAMAPRVVRHGVTFHRPLLEAGRAELRDVLEEAGLAWAEDPSNDDPGYERVRVRRALPGLAEIGLTSEALAQVAAQMGEAREVLDDAARRAVAVHVRRDAGDVILAPELFAEPAETVRRVASAALMWIGRAAYPPRRRQLRPFLDRARMGEDPSLGGVRALASAGGLRLTRDFVAVRELSAPAGEVWDGRWILGRPGEGEVRALGEAGLAACPDWRATGRPRAALIAAPALWRGETLLAAPLAGDDGHAEARIVADFPLGALSD